MTDFDWQGSLCTIILQGIVHKLKNGIDLTEEQQATVNAIGPEFFKDFLKDD